MDNGTGTNKNRNLIQRHFNLIFVRLHSISLYSSHTISFLRQIYTLFLPVPQSGKPSDRSLQTYTGQKSPLFILWKIKQQWPHISIPSFQHALAAWGNRCMEAAHIVAGCILLLPCKKGPRHPPAPMVLPYICPMSSEHRQKHCIFHPSYIKLPVRRSSIPRQTFHSNTTDGLSYEKLLSSVQFNIPQETY